jgi:hypothetical protein
LKQVLPFYQLENSTVTSTPPPAQENYQVLRLFYQPLDDVNFYHVTCKMIGDMENPDDNNYDFEFFYQSYHVTCKLLPHSLVLSILNKEVYGMDFNVEDLKRKDLLLTSYQKLNLKLNLKQVLPFYLDILSDYNGNTSSFCGNIGDNTTQSVSMVDSQNNVMPNNDYRAQ